jgi:DNA-binding response OmpR family regulator
MAIRALVVDDEPMVLRLVSIMLENHNYLVKTLASGQKALELFISQTEPFDFLLTDITMPEMDGRELVKELRIRGVTIPVLFMTGFAAEKDSPSNWDCCPLIAKPFTAPELIAAVEELLSEIGT